MTPAMASAGHVDPMQARWGLRACLNSPSEFRGTSGTVRRTWEASKPRPGGRCSWRTCHDRVPARWGWGSAQDGGGSGSWSHSAARFSHSSRSSGVIAFAASCR